MTQLLIVIGRKYVCLAKKSGNMLVWKEKQRKQKLILIIQKVVEKMR